MDSSAALTKLKEGNKRFMENRLSEKKNGAEDRKALTKGQQPYAVILTCSDSRVAPEIIFDASFNEIFVIRNAGNVATEVELASVEYALEHLRAPLVVAMGHEKCGAVKAACDIVADTGDCDGNFKAIFDQIYPSAVKHKDKDDKTTLAEYDNARHTKQRVLESEIVKGLVDSGAVTVHCARYKIESGEVEFFE
ncbi:MAG: carbonic anhydrase [Clostridiales bacterium]|nr:carbonic anhydrase [Clostridiales bacterium]